jgi:endonuclease/exonuclease/phosphatase family metal-dependent hydrolase
MGISGFTTTSWSSDTLNCTDPSKPLNAWGIHLPQTELARIREDPAIVAFAVQEAWNCGNPANINGELGFQTITREQNGTALAVRYGFATAPTYTKVSSEDWAVGGRVCLNAACSATIPIFAAHWSSEVNDYGPMAQSTLALLRSQPTPHVLMGDLNVYRVDTWNPKVRCTGDDVAGRVDAIQQMEAAGYVDAWKATQSSEGWTGMASRAGCGEPSGNLFKRIDYVYTIGSLTAISATRIARAAPGADAPSDHVALVAELRLPSSSGR